MPDVDFSLVYQQAVCDVCELYTQRMQESMARHNRGWAPGRTDFREYLRRSEPRFRLAADAIRNVQALSVCDVGGLWGVLPLTLKRLGLPLVAMTEALQYYDEAFSPLFSFLSSEGVLVVDFDPFDPDTRAPGPYNAVTAMAVIEHYPHSLRTFMRHLRTMSDGYVYLEVPNIAYWPKRMALMRGISPLAPIEDVYASEVPFIGHHHEFTRRELLTLCELSGLRVLAEHAYDYSSQPRFVYGHGVRAALESIGELLGSALRSKIPEARECLSVLSSVAAAPVVGGER